MYAVFETGGHQYKVEEGESLVVDYLTGDEGQALKFDKVLMLGGDNPSVGAPHVGGASIEATIEKQGRAKKIIVYHFRRRKDSMKKQGHKQPMTTIKINKING